MKPSEITTENSVEILDRNTVMGTIPPNQSESPPVSSQRLLEIQNEEQEEITILRTAVERLAALSREREEILTKTKRAKKPIELKFDKNLISWNGGALHIIGKGYKFLKVLYEAESMQLGIAVFEKSVWEINEADTDKMLKQATFIQFVRWLSKKLDTGNFPYILTQVKSEERTEDTGEMRNGKPVKMRIRSETIGAKLHTR
jgi:hypothetical protein